MDTVRDYLHIYESFQADVLKDTKHKRHCKAIFQAAKRHKSDLAKQKKKTFPYTFDFAYAHDCCRFMESIAYVEGKWETPTITLYSFQVWVFSIIVGWRFKNDLLRKRFNQALLLVGRKQGKSTISAAFGLYCFLCENEIAPLCLVAATTGQQAHKVFSPARLMALNNKDLIQAFGLRILKSKIESYHNQGTFTIITSNSEHQDGHSPHLAICDEGHQLPTDLYNVLRSADGTRDNYLLLMISTGGLVDAGACWELMKTCRIMLKGKAELARTAAFIFELDTKDSIDNRDNWQKANPALRDDCKSSGLLMDSLESMYQESRTNSTLAFEFERKRMNRWGGTTSSYYRPEQWAKLKRPIPDPELIEQTILAFDLASVSDMTALVELHLLTTGDLYVIPTSGCPETHCSF